MTITMAKLRRFQKIRNKSGFPSNLQFQLDAQEAGFETSELPMVEAFILPGAGNGYRWNTEIVEGPRRLRRIVRMVEWQGRIYLEGGPQPGGYAADRLPDSAELFKWIDEEATWPNRATS